MCTTWTEKQWEENSQPAMARSRYTQIATRYNQDGAIARVYHERGGIFWAVRPGYGNYTFFYRADTDDKNRANALENLASNGFDLEEDPTKATPAPAPEPEVAFVISALATNLV